MEYFARVVQTLDDLPAPIRDALAPYQAAERIGLLVFVPPQELFAAAYKQRFRRSWLEWRWTPHRTLAFGADEITVVEGTTDDDLCVIHIRLPDLLEIAMTTVLLYTSVELTWLAGGRVEQISIEFNSVSRGLVERGVTWVRAALAVHENHLGLVEQPVVSYRHFPFKFFNYTWLSLLKDEHPRLAIYEPAIRKAGRRWWRYYSPNRAVVLTPQCLIVVEDEIPRLVNSYRIAQRFFPCGQIRYVTLTPQPDVTHLTVALGSVQSPHMLSLPLLGPQADQLYMALEHWLINPGQEQPSDPTADPQQ
ncbi:MAG: hypothetical protein JXB47_09035 [Anaerolineae bacterium]|nr:hypothetical protein [Anaerolineae bacterium]